MPGGKSADQSVGAGAPEPEDEDESGPASAVTRPVIESMTTTLPAASAIGGATTTVPAGSSATLAPTSSHGLCPISLKRSAPPAAHTTWPSPDGSPTESSPQLVTFVTFVLVTAAAVHVGCGDAAVSDHADRSACPPAVCCRTMMELNAPLGLRKGEPTAGALSGAAHTSAPADETL